MSNGLYDKRIPILLKCRYTFNALHLFKLERLLKNRTTEIQPLLFYLFLIRSNLHLCGVNMYN